MKLQIRNSVFETNSSSTHSIAIVAKSKDKLKLTELPKKIYFGFGEYGWEWEEYTSYIDKANYFWTALTYCVSAKSQDELINKINNYKHKIINILNAVGIYDIDFEQPKIDHWKDYNGNNYYQLNINGYIDHAEDMDEFINDLLDNPVLFLSYLFDTYSTIFTGNDNDDRELKDISNMGYEYEFYKGN